MVIFAKILQAQRKEKPDYCLGPLHTFCNVFYSFIWPRPIQPWKKPRWSGGKAFELQNIAISCGNPNNHC